MRSMVFNWPTDDVELIVVTDGSRILGLGDLGTNGMGIPIGKLSLYTACGGIHPSKCLPVVIDVGTNNTSLLDDPMYLGLQQKRLTGDAYDAIFDEFIKAIRQRFPNVLVQFEDFSIENASRILEKYRNKILCFNDDMQGTATVALAGVLSGLRALGNQDAKSALCNQRIVVVGAGTAGLGVSRGILFNMMQSGLSKSEAHKRFWIVDNYGSLGYGRNVQFKNQEEWVRNDIQDKMSLEELIKQVKPTIILGLTGVGGLFSQNSIREMAKHCDRPIIFPLSNPTKNAECKAEDAYKWTEGKCIFGSGSPFAPVDYNGKLLIPAQPNNMYSYPGIGLGALVSKAKLITDRMLNSAAIALAESVSEEELRNGRIFPRVKEIPNVSRKVAFAVAKQAFADNLSRLSSISSDDDLRQAIYERFWIPKYGSIIRVEDSQI
jgi:malate dehydrogenase (oxaloacetate-decarboxylating)(NADP+)